MSFTFDSCCPDIRDNGRRQKKSYLCTKGAVKFNPWIKEEDMMVLVAVVSPILFH